MQLPEVNATLTLTGSLSHIVAVLDRLQASDLPVTTEVTPEPEAPAKPPRQTKKKAKKKAASKKDEPAAPSFDAVRGAVQDLIQAKGRDVAVNLIKSMGAEKVSGIPEEKWGETITEARALIEGE